MGPASLLPCMSFTRAGKGKDQRDPVVVDWEIECVIDHQTSCRKVLAGFSLKPLICSISVQGLL